MNACTIIARNYLPHARVLAESFLQHHPDGRFTALVIDLAPDEQVSESFRVVSPYEIGLGTPEIHAMAMIYDLKEFATAVKPFLLATLLSDAPDATYFDPDIQVFAGLEDISQLAQEHSIVLTPHTTAPLPRDGLIPDDQMILRAGVYNLGFISVGDSAASFLTWWSERLRRDCRVAVDQGLFVDQRWVDFVPSLFQHHVLGDPSVNVAFWNLHERTLLRNGDSYEVNGRPLRFFHFSGYDARSPEKLSVHTEPRPRIRLEDRPDLARLCDEYGALLGLHGFGGADGWTYRYDTLPNGVPVDAHMRRSYREALQSADAGLAQAPPDPFDESSAPAFEAWLQARAGASSRPRASREQPALPPRAERRARGINVIGHLEAELGLGEIARRLVTASEAAGIPTSTITSRGIGHRQEHRFPERGGGAPYDTNVICVNADKLAKLRVELGVEVFAGRYSIGVWFWELSQFPATMYGAFDFVDEVWVASEFVRAAISAATTKPVFVVPVPLEAPAAASLSRAELELPEGFLYLFSFDYFGVFERKNPIGLVEAFKRAFAPEDGAALLVRSINGDRHAAAREGLERAVVGRDDIRVVDGYVSPAARDSLMAACDCYVSLHRSEGLGLTMAEAMSFGKPVVATGYSGNLTFMDERNSYLVRYALTQVPENCEPYVAGVEWADPDLDHAAELMRRVYEERGEAERIGRQAAEDIRERHSLGRTAEFMRARLEQIPESGRRFADVRAPLDYAAELASLPPGHGLDEPEHGGRTGLIRRLLRRALWPELAEQRRLDAAVIESMRRFLEVYGADVKRRSGSDAP